MKTIWLKNNLENKQENLENLLIWLNKKSKKNLDNYISAYEIWKNKEINKIYTTLTRTAEIEKDSIKKINSFFVESLEKSFNHKSKIILDKLSKIA